MTKEQLFEKIRSVNIGKLTLEDVKNNLENEYWRADNQPTKMKYANEWCLSAILLEVSKMHNS